MEHSDEADVPRESGRDGASSSDEASEKQAALGPSGPPRANAGRRPRPPLDSWESRELTGAGARPDHAASAGLPGAPSCARS